MRVQSNDPTLTERERAKVELNEQKKSVAEIDAVPHALDDSDRSHNDIYMGDLANESKKYLKSHDDRDLPYNNDIDIENMGAKHFREPPKDFKLALEEQSKEIKYRSCNTVKINIAFVDGRIIMATKYNLVELKINKILGPDFEDPDESDEDMDRNEEPPEERDAKLVYADDDDKLIIHLQTRHIKKVAIYSDYIFHRFIDIGKNRTAMIMENESTNQIRFILLTTKCESNRIGRLQKERRLATSMGTAKGTMSYKKKIAFKVLGMTQMQPKTEVYGISPILKICTATFELNQEDSSDCVGAEKAKSSE